MHASHDAKCSSEKSFALNPMTKRIQQYCHELLWKCLFHRFSLNYLYSDLIALCVTLWNDADCVLLSRDSLFTSTIFSVERAVCVNKLFIRSFICSVVWVVFCLFYCSSLRSWWFFSSPFFRVAQRQNIAKINIKHIRTAKNQCIH